MRFGAKTRQAAFVSRVVRDLEDVDEKARGNLKCRGPWLQSDRFEVRLVDSLSLN